MLKSLVGFSKLLLVLEGAICLELEASSIFRAELPFVRRQDSISSWLEITSRCAQAKFPLERLTSTQPFCVCFPVTVNFSPELDSTILFCEEAGSERRFPVTTAKQPSCD